MESPFMHGADIMKFGNTRFESAGCDCEGWGDVFDGGGAMGANGNDGTG